jgi:large subunit ribosomal protein L6
MSRVGKYPVPVPQGVTVELKEDKITVKGKRGELSTRLLGNVTVTHQDGQIAVQPIDESKFARSMWGTTRANIQNLMIGVTEGFTKNLELQGVGFKVNQKNKLLVLFLGYSHEIYYVLPEGVEAKVEKNTSISLQGSDKQLVGQVAAEIRALRKPEPYKGKGVRYTTEYVRIKEGKKK